MAEGRERGSILGSSAGTYLSLSCQPGRIVVGIQKGSVKIGKRRKRRNQKSYKTSGLRPHMILGIIAVRGGGIFLDVPQ
jgi:hypothetical protein